MAPIPIPASSAGASDIAVIGSNVVLAASYLGGTSSILDLTSGRVSPLSEAPSRLDARNGILVGSGAPNGALLTGIDLSATDLSGAVAAVGPSGEIVAYSPADAGFFRAREGTIDSRVGLTRAQVTIDNPTGGAVEVTAGPRVNDVVVLADGSAWYIDGSSRALIKLSW
jgi:hypothetical protein